MKKILLTTVATLASISSVTAAEVKLYGFLDYAIQAMSTKYAFSDESREQVRMITGERNGNRWGLKGQEKLGSDLTIKFHLESGFNADDGSLLANRIFSRQATLIMESPYGSIKFGRTGGMNAPNDSFLNTAVIASAWGGGTCNGGTSFLWYNSREDNVLEYMTPEINGFTGYLHYSFNANGQETVKENDNQRVIALGARYHNNFWDVRMAWERNMMPSADSVEDPQSITAAARLRLNPVVVSVAAQYVKHVRSFGATGSFSNDSLGTLNNYKSDYFNRTGNSAGNLSNGLEGYGVGLGAWYDYGAWRYIAQLSRLNYKVEDTGEKVGYWMSSVGFHYSISKQTSLWGIAAYGNGTDEAQKYQMSQVTVGIRKSF